MRGSSVTTASGPPSQAASSSATRSAISASRAIQTSRSPLATREGRGEERLGAVRHGRVGDVAQVAGRRGPRRTVRKRSTSAATSPDCGEQPRQRREVGQARCAGRGAAACGRLPARRRRSCSTSRRDSTVARSRRPRTRPVGSVTVQQPPPAGRRAHDAVGSSGSTVRAWQRRRPPVAGRRIAPSDLPARSATPGVPAVRGTRRAESAPSPRPRRPRHRARRRASCARVAVNRPGRDLAAPSRRGSPMPTRSRAKSCVPSSPMIERRPLWPRRCRARASAACPNGRSKSSTTTSRSSSGTRCAREHLAHGDARQVHVRRRLDEHQVEVVEPAADAGRGVTRRAWPVQPARSASRSSTIQPTLWRVSSYRLPGLPSPTTIFKPAPD